MLVALCFLGLSRTLKYTNKSIEDDILKPLKDNNIEYNIFSYIFY